MLQVWGLICSGDVWAGVDAALSDFCAAVSPLDQRARFEASRDLRRELALPLELGGLGIPQVADEAPYRAADQWRYEVAVEAGMLEQHASVAYRRVSRGGAGGPRERAPYRRRDGEPGDNTWEAVGVRSHHEAVSRDLRTNVAHADAQAFSRRRERNVQRAALWAFGAVPWIPELSIDHMEWDVMWRYTFGGITADMRERLDHPEDGFAFRGRRMEWAVRWTPSANASPLGR
jgi:hypothetical protein